MLFTFYSIKRVDCPEFMEPSSSQSVSAVSSTIDDGFDFNNNILLKKNNLTVAQRRQPSINVKGFWTLRGYRKCKKFCKL